MDCDTCEASLKVIMDQMEGRRAPGRCKQLYDAMQRARERAQAAGLSSSSSTSREGPGVARTSLHSGLNPAARGRAAVAGAAAAATATAAADGAQQKEALQQGEGEMNPFAAVRSGGAFVGSAAELFNCESELPIRCAVCSEDGAEGTARALLEVGPMEITLCANRLQNRREMEEALTHELVHAYDICVGKRDLRSCTQLAYSEVRAAREAECRVDRTKLSAFGSWIDKCMSRVSGSAAADGDGVEGVDVACVRSSAIQATSAMFPQPGMARRCVDSVLREAVRDLQPVQEEEEQGKEEDEGE